VILAGGGLANGLIGFWLGAARPALRVVAVEAGPTIGGNHTWSFHTSDVPPATYAALEPLIVARWPGQDVRFPRFSRTLATGYNTISSDRLHAVVGGRLDTVMTGCTVVGLGADTVRLADGRVLRAPCVIDGRGFMGQAPLLTAYQKFAGLEIETRDPHGLSRPIIMDATVAQIDGYRFIYTLPLDDRRLLIEDTRYSDTDALDRPALHAALRRYAADQGWSIAAELREEAGVLPITLDGDIARHWAGLDAGIAHSGMRALLFHAATGYSLPLAAALAERIAALPLLTSAAVAETVRAMSRKAWEQQSFYRMLNRLLFVAARPDERVRILERFYTLPEPLIQRFYAGRPTLADKARILIGKPPIPIPRALTALPARSAHRHPAAVANARGQP